MGFTALLSKMLVLFVFICVGVLCAKVRILDERACGSLNQMVLYICGPMLILHSVQSADAAYGIHEVLLLLLFSALLMLLSLLVAAAASFLFCRKSPLRGTFSLVIAFGNIVFMGIPVVTALYGAGAVFLLSICAIPFNFFIFTIGIFLLIGGKKQPIPWKKLLINPSLYATLLAFALFLLKVRLPATVTDIMAYLGQMVVPLSMILIGASLARMRLGKVFGTPRCYAVCAFKLLVVPLVCHFILRLFVRDPLILGLLTVMSAMPSASISPILCAEYGGDGAFASRSVFLTTLLSLLSIPLIVWLTVGGSGALF